MAIFENARSLFDRNKDPRNAHQRYAGIFASRIVDVLGYVASRLPPRTGRLPDGLEHLTDDFEPRVAWHRKHDADAIALAPYHMKLYIGTSGAGVADHPQEAGPSSPVQEPGEMGDVPTQTAVVNVDTIMRVPLQRFCQKYGVAWDSAEFVVVYGTLDEYNYSENASSIDTSKTVFENGLVNKDYVFCHGRQVPIKVSVHAFSRVFTTTEHVPRWWTIEGATRHCLRPEFVHTEGQTRKLAQIIQQATYVVDGVSRHAKDPLSTATRPGVDEIDIHVTVPDGLNRSVGALLLVSDWLAANTVWVKFGDEYMKIGPGDWGGVFMDLFTGLNLESAFLQKDEELLPLWPAPGHRRCRPITFRDDTGLYRVAPVFTWSETQTRSQEPPPDAIVLVNANPRQTGGISGGRGESIADTA